MAKATLTVRDGADGELKIVATFDPPLKKAAKPTAAQAFMAQLLSAITNEQAVEDYAGSEATQCK